MSKFNIGDEVLIADEQDRSEYQYRWAGPVTLVGQMHPPESDKWLAQNGAGDHRVVPGHQLRHIDILRRDIEHLLNKYLAMQTRPPCILLNGRIPESCEPPIRVQRHCYAEIAKDLNFLLANQQ